MTAAILGLGIVVQMALPATPTVLTTLDEVFDFQPPTPKVDTVDATHYQSPGGYREFIGGLKEGGEAAMMLNHIPYSATDVYLNAANGTTRVIKVTWPNGAITTFLAVITEYGPDKTPVDGKLTSSCKLKVTGTPTQLAATAPVNQLLPSISGVLTVGSTLTVNEGQWTPAANTYTYQWRKNAVNIGGAINKTYVPVAGDVAAGLDCVVTATNNVGSTPATSPKTANIA